MNIEVQSFKRTDVPVEYLTGSNINNLLFWLFFDWFIIFSCWFLMMNTTPWASVLWLMIIGGRFHGFGVLVHDLCHHVNKPKTWKRRLIEIGAGYPIGSTIESMAYHHLRHHRNTMLYSDPYFHINKKTTGSKRFLLTLKKGILFAPFWISGGFLGAIAYYIPSLRNVYGRTFLQDVSGKDLTNSQEIIRNCKEARYQSLFHLILFTIAYLYLPFLFYGFYLALPIGGIFCIYRLLIEHQYDIIENQSVYNIIDCTYDHHLSIWGRFFFAPHNIGYHCMHHIHPNVGMDSLPRLKKWYEDHCSFYREKLMESRS